MSGSIQVRDSAGYTYVVDYSITVGSANSSIANSTPGHTEITMSPIGSVRVTNSTTGRNAPIPDGFSFHGLFEASSPVCAVAILDADTAYPLVGFGKVCVIQYSAYTAPDGSTGLAPADSLDLTESPASTQPPVDIKEVPEASAPAIADALQHPLAFVLLGDSYGLQAGCGAWAPMMGPTPVYLASTIPITVDDPNQGKCKVG